MEAREPLTSNVEGEDIVYSFTKVKVVKKIDVGFIMVETTAEDIERIQPILKKTGLPKPNIKMAIYKNRANEHKNEYLFINADKGICRYEGLFMTDLNYNLLDVPDIKIRVQEESAF